MIGYKSTATWHDSLIYFLKKINVSKQIQSEKKKFHFHGIACGNDLRGGGWCEDYF